MPTMIRLVIIFVLSWSAGAANAELIDFEDLDASTGIWIPQGYHGFSWLGGGRDNGTTSWVNSANLPLYQNYPGYTALAHSGVNYAWSDGGVYLELSDGLFNLESLWVSTFSDNVTFEGLLAGDTIFTKSVRVNTNEKSYIQAVLNFSGIDTLRFDSDINYNVQVDDISFSRAPISSTLALFALSIAILGLYRTRKMQ